MMRALTLDYVKASQARPISLAILATSFVFAGYLAKSYIDLRQEKAHWQSQIARLQEEQRRVQAQDKGSEDQATLKPEITRANEVIHRLAIPWDKLFTTLENVHFNDVALLSIQPDTAKQFITLTAEAKDMASMLEYMRRLSKEPMFSGIQLTSHQLQLQDPQKPIRFVVTANWKTL